MFVVAGITGNTGKIVAQTLTRAGRQVRALVRSEAGAEQASRSGFEPFLAPLEDHQRLEAALRGAEGAYLLVPPHYGPGILEQQRRVAASIASALTSTRPSRTVLLSSVGAERPSGTGPIVSVHELERATAHLSGVTYLRAAYFAENWLGALGAALSDRVLPSFLPQGEKPPMVATRDIGEIAAQVLLGEVPAERILQLAGPSDLAPADVAAEFSEALGMPISPLDLPTVQVTPTFVQFGVPEELARLFEELYGAAHRGELAFSPSYPLIRGKIALRELVRQANATR